MDEIIFEIRLTETDSIQIKQQQGEFMSKVFGLVDEFGITGHGIEINSVDTMRWLTNVHINDAPVVYRELSEGHDRPVVLGRPRRAGYSAEKLEKDGLIGLYRVDEKVPEPHIPS